MANARWSDNLPVLFQEKVIQSFENAGYSQAVSRTRDGIRGCLPARDRHQELLVG